MNYFFDSSALIKRYVNEQGTNWVSASMERNAGHTLLIGRITPVELISGIERRKRDGQISQRTATAARLLIRRHVIREYVVIDLVDEIVNRAEDLLVRYALRAYDSIQLATALVTNDNLIRIGLSSLIFVSSDQRLLTTAVAEGLTTDDPNLHP